MPRQPIGSLAYRTLANLLDLPGDFGIRHIETGEVFPVQDLTQIMHADLLGRRRMVHQEVHVGGQTTTFGLDPYTATAWNEVVVDGASRTTQLAIPQTHDALITGAGLWVNLGGANLTDAHIRFDSGLALGTVSTLLFHADTVTQGNAFQSGGETMITPPPWLLLNLKEFIGTLGGVLVSSGNVTANFILDVIHGPKGSIPRIP